DPKCGACEPCRSGRPANCVSIVALGVHRDGALARFVTAPADSVYRIDPGVPAEMAALVEPLACVVNGTNRAAIRPGESVVVFGAGTIGCLFIAVFRASGAGRIVAVEPSSVRAEVARAVGADLALSPEDWAARRGGLLPQGADVVVDAVGSVLPQAIEAAGMGGRIVVFGVDEIMVDDAWMPEPDEMLDWMVDIGFEGTELGMPGFLGNAAEVHERLSTRGLAFVGSFLPQHFSRAEKVDQDRAWLRDQLRLVREAAPAGSVPYAILSDQFDEPDRRAFSGRIAEHPETWLSPARFATLIDN